MEIQIRPVITSDILGIKKVLDSSGLFPSEYLDDMISDYFNNPVSEEIWFTGVINKQPIALGYCVPEKLTEGTYNLYALAVHADAQKKGVGKDMMKYIEDLLRANSERVLIVETSSDPSQYAACEFYKSLKYIQVAVIPDFWKDGEDKVVFWKKLV